VLPADALGGIDAKKFCREKFRPRRVPQRDRRAELVDVRTERSFGRL
jgi:hypothetical protein